MNISEWLDIAADIRDRWPHSDLDEDALKRQGEDLSDLPGAHVRAAVEVIARGDREFAPSAGVIRKKVIELRLDAPPWAEVLNQLEELQEVPQTKLMGFKWVNDTEVQVLTAHPRAEALKREHPLIAGFVETVGWKQIDRGLHAGGNDEARLRQKWDAYRKGVERDAEVAGLEPVEGLPALERVAGRDGQPARVGSVLDRVLGSLAEAEAPVKALPAGKAPEAHGEQKLGTYQCPGCSWTAQDVKVSVALKHLKQDCPARAEVTS